MKSRSRKLIGVLILSIFLIGIGYAVLSSKLVINGIGAFSKNSWIIYFDDIRPAEGSVETASQPAIITNPEKTNIQFDVDLNTPGDFYEFDVYIKNDGTIDAMIDEVIMPELTEEQKKYMKFSYTYVDGTKIKKCDELKAQNFRDTRLRVEYLEDADLDIMPDDGLTHFDVTITYVQESECELDKIDVELDPNGGIYNETTEVTTVVLSDGQEYTVGVPTREGYTFIKWNEITDSNSYSDDKVTFKGKNVRLRAEWQVSDNVVARIDREESIYYVTIQAAIDDARDNEMIHLLKNTSEVFTNNKNVTLNLEGYKVTGSGANEEGYSLTIINGSIENEDGVGFVNKGTLTIGINDDHLCDVGDLSHTCDYVDGFVSLIGTTRGLTQDGTFNFYDGFIEGKLAIFGAANDTPTYIHPQTQDETYYIVFVDRDLIRQDQKAYLSDQPNRAVSKTIVGGNIYYLDLSLNFDASVVTGYKIYAVRDFEGAYEVTVPENEEIEFDIIGKKVTLGNNINNNGKLKIINSQEEGYIELAHIIKNKGTLELDNLTINEITSESNMIEPIGESNIILKNTYLKTNNGLVLNNKYKTTLTMDDDSIIESTNKKAISNESELTINGGTVKSRESVVNVKANTVTNINSANIITTYSAYSVVGSSKDNSIVNIKDSVLNKTIEYCYINFVDTDVIIESGNYNVLYNCNGVVTGGNLISKTESAVIINSNIEFNNVNIENTYNSNSAAGIRLGSFMTVSINGGSVKAKGIAIDLNSTRINEQNSVTITSGTIIGGVYGIRTYNPENKVYLGKNDGEISKTTPEVIGGQYAIYNVPGSYSSGGKIFFYDGILKGKVKGYNEYIYDSPDGSLLFNEDTEEIDGETYHLTYLKQEIKYLKYNNEFFNSINKILNDYPNEEEYDIDVVDDGIIANYQSIPENKTVTLDFKGHELYTTTTIINNGKLVFKDTSDSEPKGRIYSNLAYILRNNNEFELNDVTMEITSKTDIFIMDKSNVKFTVNSGKIKTQSRLFYGTNGTATLTINGGEVIVSDWNGGIREGSSAGGYLNIVVNGGKLSSSGCILGVNGGSLIVNGGEVEYNNVSETNVVITGGRIYNNSTSKNGFLNRGSVTISGGILENNIESDSSYILSGTGSLEMSGGTLKSKGKGITNVTTVKIYNGVIDAKYEAIEIKGGNTTFGTLDNTIDIESPYIKGGTYAVKKTKGVINFYDGVFKGITDSYVGVIDKIPDETIIKNDTIEEIDDETYKVAYLVQNVPFLQVGEHTYSSFNTLLSEESGTDLEIDVIANGKISSPQTLTGNITLDLHGFEIESTQTITNDGNIEILDTSSNHSGKIYSSNASILIINNRDKTFTLTGGTIELTNGDNTSGRIVIDNKGILNLNSEHSKVDMYRFEPANTSWSANIRNSNAVVNINGGSIFVADCGISGGTVVMTSGKIYTDPNYRYVDGIDGSNFTMSGGLIDVTRVGIRNSKTTLGAGTVKGEDGFSTTTTVSLNMTGGEIIGTNSGISACCGGYANLNVTGGTISSDKNSLTGNLNGKITNAVIIGGIYGINISAGTLSIGENDGTIKTNEPIITGGSYGLNRTGGYINFYDGIFKGKAGAISGVINDIADNSSIRDDNETITEDDNEITYYTKYLTSDYEYIKNLTTNAKYRNLTLAISTASSGDTLQLFESGIEYKAITIDKDLTIDLNGTNLYIGKTLTIAKDINVNITNSSDESSKIYSNNNVNFINNLGTVNIDNITLENTMKSGYSLINNNGNMVIDNSIINCGGRTYSTENKTTNVNVLFKNTIINAENIYQSGNMEFNNSTVNSNIYTTDVSTTKILNNTVLNDISYLTWGDTIVDHSEFNLGTATFGQPEISSTATITNSKFTGRIESYSNLEMDEVELDRQFRNDYYVVNTHKDVTLNNLNINTPENDYFYHNYFNFSGTGNVNINNVTANFPELDKYHYSNAVLPFIQINGPTVLADGLYLDYSNVNTNNKPLTTGVYVKKGTFNFKSGYIKIKSNYARGIQLEENGIVNMGEAEPLTSDNLGTANADVSLTNPYVEAIGFKTGYAIYNENGYYNFYDGKIKGSTNARFNEASSGVEFLWEITSYHDDDNNEYSILEYMGQ